MAINIQKISNEEKAREYKSEEEAQTKIEELNMQDTHKKWNVMVDICLNVARKVLGEIPKSKKNRYENEEIV